MFTAIRGYIHDFYYGSSLVFLFPVGYVGCYPWSYRRSFRGISSFRGASLLFLSYLLGGFELFPLRVVGLARRILC